MPPFVEGGLALSGNDGMQVWRLQQLPGLGVMLCILSCAHNTNHVAQSCAFWLPPAGICLTLHGEVSITSKKSSCAAVLHEDRAITLYHEAVSACGVCLFVDFTTRRPDFSMCGRHEFHVVFWLMLQPCAARKCIWTSMHPTAVLYIGMFG